VSLFDGIAAVLGDVRVVFGWRGSLALLRVSSAFQIWCGFQEVLAFGMKLLTA
jgi:hypothetical protein